MGPTSVTYMQCLGANVWAELSSRGRVVIGVWCHLYVSSTLYGFFHSKHGAAVDSGLGRMACSNVVKQPTVVYG